MKSLPLILTTLILVMLLAAYVGVYVKSGTYQEWPPIPGFKTLAWRCYPTKLQAAIFRPAAWIESKIRGHQVDSTQCTPHPEAYTP